MSREQRWYWTIRLALIGGLIGALTVLWIVVIQQAQIFAMSTNDCGCAVAPLRWPMGVMLGTGLVAVVTMIISIRLIAAIAVRAWRHVRLAKEFHRDGRRLWHYSAKVSYWLVNGQTEQAMTLGLLRPHIIITTGLLHRLNGSEFASVLRHEQAHARNWDPLWSLLLEAVGETLGWVAGVRSLVNTAFSLREVLADSAATKNYTRVAGLSGAIAKLATTAYPQSIPAFSPNNDRVNKLLDHTWQLPAPQLNWRTGLLAVVVAIGIFAAGRLPAATAAAQPTLPAEACWLRQTMCAGTPSQEVIFMSPTGVMSRYDW